MERQPVQSSNIASVGYDPNTRTLEVQFNSGKVYSYADVPPEKYAAMMDASSKGKFFSVEIRNRYEATFVSG